LGSFVDLSPSQILLVSFEPNDFIMLSDYNTIAKGKYVLPEKQICFYLMQPNVPPAAAGRVLAAIIAVIRIARSIFFKRSLSNMFLLQRNLINLCHYPCCLCQGDDDLLVMQNILKIEYPAFPVF
jgi:hypothetical protein